MIVVKVTPPGESGVGYRMKPGDAIRVEWPGAGEIRVAVDDDGAVLVTGADIEAA